MRVRYIYSACVVIDTPGAKILCDPWFTQGAYDGSWYQYPPIADPIRTIGRTDIVYISHIHPDHYDPVFLRRYLEAYPTARLMIGKQEPPYLGNKMRIDGFSPDVVESHLEGETQLLIVANANKGDTALAVRSLQHTVVNMNDNPLCQPQMSKILDFCGERVDFALLPYSGAGPYPQTFEFANSTHLIAAAARKRQQFLDVFSAYLRALQPTKAMPFAGQYYLGGRLSALNRFRGIPDAVEVRDLHREGVIVLADGGYATYDLATRTATAERTTPYDLNAIDAYLATLNVTEYDYEREIRPLAQRTLPLLPLVAAAKRRARDRVRLEENYWVILRPSSRHSSFLLNLADDTAPIMCRGDAGFDLTPRIEISIDDRYLFGLLTRLYHWNNAEIGSHYRSLRVPEEHKDEVDDFFNMFQV